MNKSPLALVAILGLFFVAAGTNHQAFGPIHFGMNRDATSKADLRLLVEMQKDQGDRHFTAATARRHFISTGKRYAARLEAKDKSVEILMEVKCEPALSEVTVSSNKMPQRDADKLKDAWEVFQDIGDCKLPRAGQRGVFPAVDQIAVSREVVTDKWEGEGIRIELLLKSVTDAALPDPLYLAVLRATEIAPGTAK
jgi:hypothetical protein